MHVILYYGQLPHLELLSILKLGANSVAMWSAITCFTFWLPSHEPQGSAKQYLHSVFFEHCCFDLNRSLVHLVHTFISYSPN